MTDHDRPEPSPSTPAEPGDDSRLLRRLAEAVAEVHRDLGTVGGHAALQRLIERGASDLVGARWASVTVLRRERFHTLVATDDVARAIDAHQYAFGSGPCVDAAVEDATFLTPEIADEPRWAPLGERLRDELGVRSMLAYRLHLLDENDSVAALNFASDRRDAFSRTDVHRGLVLASHCALLVTADAAHTKAENLLKGLESNREIGIAVGVLMARHGLTRQQAFDILRVASQTTNRKLVDVATEVGDTGVAPIDLDVDRAP
ncbi:GAF and ANTAR domain-containing protein [Oryzobacter terrae]|uniref:GAF and ANTAR domain-containing protein n=1 Tax=Oryzobacter terrae TaxID=1620385 RepID=UPI00366DEF04